MSKFFSKFFLIIITVLISALIFLSFFGLETKKFDNLIKTKANEINKNVKLEFEKTKIHLDIKELKLLVKLQDPKVLVKNNEIDLSKLDLFLSLKSFFTEDFLLTRADVAFVKNDIKDLTKITNIFLPRFINKKLNKIFAKGNLEGEFIIPFNIDGKVSKDYKFTGKISDALINLPKEFSLRNLTAEIKQGKDFENDGLTVSILNGSLFDLDLTDTMINLKKEKNETLIESSIHTNGKFNNSHIKKISSLFLLKNNYFKNIEGKVDLNTKVQFSINNKFKVKNILYSTSGNIFNLALEVEEKKFIKEYLPKYTKNIQFKDTNIYLTNSKSERNTELKGMIKISDKFDPFQIKEIYNFNKKDFSLKGTLGLTNSVVNIPKLNYSKSSEKKSEVIFDINFILNKIYNINSLKYSADKTLINISKVKLNKKLETEDLENLYIKTFSNDFKNNDFSIKNTNKILVNGEIFDAQPLLNTLYKKKKKKTFSKKFNNEMTINFKKAIAGESDDVSNLTMIANIKEGSYEKLNLKGNFSKDEIIEMSIYKVNNEQRTLKVISDRARPFMKNFNFIKGFEGGKLNYEATISQKETKANLLISDFKVSKVPALAQLLTLASLRGIADTLSGEGIHFDSFEMKSNSQGNILNIEDALAMGPAISILLDGYVDKGKIVSLRGTLVPATKLNSIIASIPLIGEILVGKKTGEGVVGVSFKMKGPPKDIKTTVNPIKTLTPRFIVRAIEKLKKKKKEEAK